MREVILEVINLTSHDPNWTIIKNVNFKLYKG